MSTELLSFSARKCWSMSPPMKLLKSSCLSSRSVCSWVSHTYSHHSNMLEIAFLMQMRSCLLRVAVTLRMTTTVVTPLQKRAKRLKWVLMLPPLPPPLPNSISIIITAPLDLSGHMHSRICMYTPCNIPVIVIKIFTNHNVKITMYTTSRIIIMVQ